MRIKTLSIVAGSEACNARCPFCVSKMTPLLGVTLREPEVNWHNFEKTCLLARQSGVTTAMFTGKGEPTLFPDQVSKFLQKMLHHRFPLIELQTNGIMIAEKPEIYNSFLEDWHQTGMTTIAVSIVHYDPEKNRSTYLPYRKSYIDLPVLIRRLHRFGFSVRLTCIAANGFIDGVSEILKLVEFAKINKVEQLTVTPVNKPEHPEHQEAWEWTRVHHLSGGQIKEIKDFLDSNASLFMTLAHGAAVYDFEGQNICLNNCLSVDPDTEELRNIIFFPDGHVRTHWQFPGSILF